MRNRHLPLTVPPDLYERIERLAEAEERTPIQQSVWLIKQALGEPQPAATSRDLARSGAGRPEPDQAA